MTTVVISQPMFFPWRGMFEQLALADVFVHYDDVQFSKGSFTNRVQIKTPNGSAWMTVPVQKHAGSNEIRSLRARDSDWRADHLAQLREAYRGAPFGDEVLQLVADEYDRPGALVELLIGSFERVARRLGASDGTTFLRSSELGIGGSGWPRVLDVVAHVGGSVYVTGHGAGNYLDAEAFERAGVDVRFMDYALTPYPQLHGEFTPYVSILDLLANVGPDAPAHLHPRTVGWRTFLEADDGP